MEDNPVEETRATARLPNLHFEMVHRRSADPDAESLMICLQAMPSFEAFGRYAEGANPFFLWWRFAQAAWAPWLGFASASLPAPPVKQLPPKDR